MKVHTFTTSLSQLNTYIVYFPPDHSGQPVAPLSEDEVKEIIYHTMPNLWKKKMVEKGYNYLNGSIQSMAEFFETMLENLERFDSRRIQIRARRKIPPRKGNILIRMFLWKFLSEVQKMGIISVNNMEHVNIV